MVVFDNSTPKKWNFELISPDDFLQSLPLSDLFWLPTCMYNNELVINFELKPFTNFTFEMKNDKKRFFYHANYFIFMLCTYKLQRYKFHCLNVIKGMIVEV